MVRLLLLTLLTGACAHRGDVSPCAKTKCQTGEHCVIEETFPPRAKCVPTNPCGADVNCSTGTYCKVMHTYPLSAMCVECP